MHKSLNSDIASLARAACITHRVSSVSSAHLASLVTPQLALQRTASLVPALTLTLTTSEYWDSYLDVTFHLHL